MRWMPLALAQAVLLSLTGCAQQPAHDDSLYRDLGEQPGITRIVEGMLLNIAGDRRIVRHFEDIDIVRLRDKLAEQICVEAGGPCTYSGDSMEESHEGQQLTPSVFNALVENLQDAMDQQGIAVTAQNRLLARLAPMREQVIDR
jgi:hemoglobin